MDPDVAARVAQALRQNAPAPDFVWIPAYDAVIEVLQLAMSTGLPTITVRQINQGLRALTKPEPPPEIHSALLFNFLAARLELPQIPGNPVEFLLIPLDDFTERVARLRPEPTP